MQYAGLTFFPQYKTVVFMKEDASLKARRPLSCLPDFPALKPAAQQQNQSSSFRILKIKRRIPDRNFGLFTTSNFTLTASASRHMFFFRRQNSAAIHKSSSTYRQDTVKSNTIIAPHKRPQRNGLFRPHRRFHISRHRPLRIPSVYESG